MNPPKVGSFPDRLEVDQAAVDEQFGAGGVGGIGGTAQRLPLYLKIGSGHKFIEVIDAATNTRRYRVTDRNVIVISSGPYGHPAGATGVHARRTAFCRKQLGDDNAVQQCLQENRMKLSKSCQKVFQSHGM